MEERLIELAHSDPDDREVTVYVKGFLAKGEHPDHFDAWLSSHRAVSNLHGWGPRAQGYCWQSGQLSMSSLPVGSVAKLGWDLVRVLRGARGVALTSTIGLAAAEVAGRFVYQYWSAAQSARSRAAVLAVQLVDLAQRFERVRVVAHSLGCRQVVEAVSTLALEERPHEIHLCAPAFGESDVASKLADLSRQRTLLYFTPSDLVLELAFRALAQSRALGGVGPSEPYARLEAYDVSEHFDFWVHLEYKHRLPQLVYGGGREHALEVPAFEVVDPSG